MKYISRTIDKTFEEWKESTIHKPLLLCGARQVGKSSAMWTSAPFMPSRNSPDAIYVFLFKSNRNCRLSG